MVEVDIIANKTTAIEAFIIILFLYIFPKTTITIIIVVGGLKYYWDKQKRPTNLISSETMESAFYSYDSYYIKSSPIPLIGPDQVLIQVKGASIHPGDQIVHTPKVPFYRWFQPFTIGFDFSGIIIDVGVNVLKLKKGDPVYGNACGGTLQEFTVARAEEVSLKPSNISFPEAAAIPVSGCAAYASLNHFRKLTPNDKVCVIGASGGCGNYGVQIAKSYGSKVYGVCSSKNADFVRGLGCDEVLDYTQPNYLEEIKDIKFDLILDTVSYRDTDQEKVFLPFLADDGYFVALAVAHMIDFFRTLIGFEKRKNYHCMAHSIRPEELEAIKILVENGYVKPPCEKYEFSEASIKKAFEVIESRRSVGKIIFEF